MGHTDSYKYCSTIIIEPSDSQQICKISRELNFSNDLNSEIYIQNRLSYFLLICGICLLVWALRSLIAFFSVKDILKSIAKKSVTEVPMVLEVIQASSEDPLH